MSFPFHALTKNMLIQPFNRLPISTYSAFAMFLFIYGSFFPLPPLELLFFEILVKIHVVSALLCFPLKPYLLPMSAFLMSFFSLLILNGFM